MWRYARITKYASANPEYAKGNQRQVSTNGGSSPRLSAAGDELFYWSDSTLMASQVSATSAGSFASGVPQALFQMFDVADLGTPDYDIAPDGRFLIKAKNPDAPGTQIHVVTNWLEELKAKVGN